MPALLLMVSQGSHDLLEVRSFADSCSSVNNGAALVVPAMPHSFIRSFTIADSCFSINDGERSSWPCFIHIRPHWLPSTLLGLHRKRPARISQANGGCISINDGERSSCRHCCSWFHRGHMTCSRFIVFPTVAALLTKERV